MNSLPKAREPFLFFSRLSLTAATGVRAADLRELAEGIRTVPEAAIYTHTHRFIQQHQFLVPEPTNDFAAWIAEALQDEAAAERLLAVDPVRFDTIGGLRLALTDVLEEHLKRHPQGRRAPEGDEFHFLRSIRFSVPTPYQASDLDEFREALRKVSVASLYLHVFEARIRPPLGLNDFSTWLEREFGEKELAKKIARLDPYSHTGEALRDLIATMVEQRLEKLGHG
ncbi:MAG: hypothetical protein HY553_05235 [Elusimicrobia bacterium]|nr:hypothetical protein [Elusimicrobiota bacterium]